MARPLRQQIAAMALGTAAVGGVALYYSARLTYDEQLKQLEAETHAMAATVVAYVDRNLSAVDAVAALAARHPAVVRLDPQAATDVLVPLVGGTDRLIRNAVLADTDGQPVVWATDPDPVVEGTISPTWLRVVADQHEVRLSPLLGGSAEGRHGLLMAYPVNTPDGHIMGVLGLVVHLEALGQVLRSIPLPSGSVVTLTDARSVVVARSLDAARYVGKPVEGTGRPMAPTDVPVSITRIGVDGIERVFGNSVVARGPWLASVGIPTSVARERTLPITLRHLAIAIGGMLLVGLVSMLFVERWLRSFAFLDRTAHRVAKGDLSPLASQAMPTAELERLQYSLADMITNLRSSHDAVSSQMDAERRLREELQSLQQQVIRQERLAAIGVLVSGVAHELNNPLQAILGFAELLQLQKDLPAPAHAHLSLIQKESARASNIIRNLSRFGRQTTQPSPVRLSDVVASVMELRQRRLEELDIKVDVDDRSRGVVSAVFTELQQVVLNYIINAEQAIGGRPDRRIYVRTFDVGGRAHLEVEDSGAGVPPEHESKLFQPFFTTKPVGEGTGLGLSVSYGIIRSHGGVIGHRRGARGGAVFFFELPLS
jgi:C4-dicarboxylate-specific signal transduction histidine kinase